MRNLIRTFIAVELSDEIADRIRRVQNSFKKGTGHLSWVKAENCHITLRFLGSIDEKMVEDIKNAMTASSSGVSPFSISVKGVGVFPSLKKPRVVWLGLFGARKLAAIYKVLESELSRLGFGKEGRVFQPHITIGRIRSLSNRMAFMDWMEKNRDINIGSLSIDKLTLFKSELRHSGAIYSRLGEVKLEMQGGKV